MKKLILSALFISLTAMGQYQKVDITKPESCGSAKVEIVQINQQDKVLAWCSPFYGKIIPFLWTQSGGAQEILLPQGKGKFGIPYDLSEAGHVLLSAAAATPRNAPWSYYVYNNGVHTQLFTDIQPGQPKHHALKMNSSSMIVGYTQNCNWPSCYGMGKLFTLKNGVYNYTSINISTIIVAPIESDLLVTDTGMIAGTKYYTDLFKLSGTTFTAIPTQIMYNYLEDVSSSGALLLRKSTISGTTETKLPTPAIQNLTNFFAYGFNDFGLVVGTLEIQPSPTLGYSRPFLFDGSNYIDLFQGQPLTVQGEALDVTNSGVITINKYDADDYVLVPQ